MEDALLITMKLQPTRAWQNHPATCLMPSMELLVVFVLKTSMKWLTCYFIARMCAYKVWICNNLNNTIISYIANKVHIRLCNSLQRLWLRLLVLCRWVVVYDVGLYRAVCVIGCKETECSKDVKMECKLFFAPTHFIPPSQQYILVQTESKPDCTTACKSYKCSLSTFAGE